MKHKNLSIKWKVFSYMLFFAAVLILVLWFCQTVYLGNFYKAIKEHEVKRALNELTEQLANQTEVESEIKQIASDYELCILITREDGQELYSEEYNFGCAIHKLTTEQLSMYYDQTEANGGQLEFTSNEEMKKSEIEKKINGRPLDNPAQQNQTANVSGEAVGSAFPVSEPGVQIDEKNKFSQYDGENKPIEENLVRVMKGGQESMVCAKIQVINGISCLVLVDARLTPVDATVNTLRIQLIVISFIMVILALIMAFLISRAVSIPIIKVNESAKELAKGDFDVIFDGRDYREISELSDTLNYASGELAKTERFQHELIANVSHDLRTPLTMITAYSEVMRDLPGENTPENVQVVIDEAQRLTNLVNDMLDISKLQAGVMEKESRLYDLTESIERVMERYVKLKEQDGYCIQFEYEEHVLVDADEFKIFQVLYNLINNAINYTGEDKKVTVRQCVRENKVRIEVEDTGEGIAQDELSNVWERYYKVDGNHKRAITGTGLGLSIVQNILKLHHASYGVESELGRGSVFWFELDRYMEEENDKDS